MRLLGFTAIVVLMIRVWVAGCAGVSGRGEGESSTTMEAGRGRSLRALRTRWLPTPSRERSGGRKARGPPVAKSPGTVPAVEGCAGCGVEWSVG